MSATAGHRARQQKAAAANRHRHSTQLSREQLQRENERLLRENEELRRKVAEREKQIGEREKQIVDAEKQIADLERQLALRKRNSTNSRPQMDWPANSERGAVSTKANGNRGPSPDIQGITGVWFPSSR